MRTGVLSPGCSLELLGKHLKNASDQLLFHSFDWGETQVSDAVIHPQAQVLAHVATVVRSPLPDFSISLHGSRGLSTLDA